MEYTNYTRHRNEPVDGFILQAPISDREGLAPMFPSLNDNLEVANKLVSDGKEKHLMPIDQVPYVYSAPMTAYRLQSLVKPG
jgi:hypothetical protein